MKRHHHLPEPPELAGELPPKPRALAARKPVRKMPAPAPGDARHFADFLAAAMTLPPDLLADFQP